MLIERRLDEEKALYEQKKKETDEPYLYLSIKIVTPAIFERYQGFDLVNFKERQYPLSELPQFKILKSETYEAFKTMISQKFEIPVEQIRLWIFVKRQNRTIRPDTPITDDFLGKTMEIIRKKMVRRYNELKLFLEVAKPINGKVVLILLYYEMLDISIVELETKKFFKVYWLGTTVKEEDVIDICLPKTAIVNQIFQIIINKLALKHTSRIRLYDVLRYKIQKEYDINDPIDEIEENITLYAEEIPQDEIKLGTKDKVIRVFHFAKEPLCAHGIPFKFVIKAGEPFSMTKLRLKLRLGMNEKDFTKVKVAVIQELSYAKPQYIDDNVILSDYELTDELLGLDHFASQKLEIA
ncbi:749_t:CDS:2, partial [Dentiscutata erythropus]